MSRTVKVRVPENLDRSKNWYLTPGKTYSAKVQMRHDDGDMLFLVTADSGARLLCLRYRCTHLAGLDWEVVQ